MIEFLTGEVVAYSGSISFSSGAVFDGNRVNFGTMVNADATPATLETIILRTVGRIKNSTDVRQATNRHARGRLYYDITSTSSNTPLDIILPSISLDKGAQPFNNLNASSPTTFDLTITNSGLATGYNISLQDMLPATLSLSGAVSGSLDRSTPLTNLFTSGIVLDSLAPGSSETVTFQALTATDARAGSIHINT
jgi:uncharacterized repeat protein (TIGR01451 family)